MKDIELVVLDYLLSQDIEGIEDHVYLEAPEHPPRDYVLIEKSGSGETDRICQAMIAVQSVSSDRDHGRLTALRINSRVKEAMAHMADTENVYSCRLNSDYNFTDRTLKQYRYQAVFNIHY